VLLTFSFCNTQAVKPAQEQKIWATVLLNLWKLNFVNLYIKLQFLTPRKQTIYTKGKKKLMVFGKIIGVCKIHNKCEYIIWPETQTLRRVIYVTLEIRWLLTKQTVGLWKETYIGEYSRLNTTDFKIRHQYSDKCYERKRLVRLDKHTVDRNINIILVIKIIKSFKR